MSPMMRTARNIFLLTLFFFSNFAFAQADYKTARVKCREDSAITTYGDRQCTPDFGLSGSAELLTHFAYRGLSYSGTQPSFISSFLYNFGSQFKIGAWGANLNLADSNLWLKFVMEIQMKFANSHDVTLYLHRDQFYSNGERNGVEVGLNYYFLEQYFLTLSTKSNFEATKASAEYLAFAYTVRIAQKTNFSYKFGYTSQHQQNLDNYVDGKISISYDLKNSTLEAGLTDMSSKDKYNQKAEPHFYGSLLAFY
jgi:uncharacterized protein (TIGR02001 family)